MDILEPAEALQFMDYDGWLGDDLIGRTVMDLEDRWFDPTWRALGAESKCSEPGKVRWNAKPVEQRPLRTPAQQQPQGFLTCWVDILEPAEALQFPAVDIALPPPKKFEVRVVVWHAKDVVSMEALTGMSDTFVKVGLHGCADQSTDVHWRAKKGKASWNYRLKFDVLLGPKTPTMKFPYLKLQMWDKELLLSDDLIAETNLSLDKFLLRAFRESYDAEKKGRSVKLFEDPPKLTKAGRTGSLRKDLGAAVTELQDVFAPSDEAYAQLFSPVEAQEVAASVRRLAESTDALVSSARDDGEGAGLAALYDHHAGAFEGQGVELMTMNRDVERKGAAKAGDKPPAPNTGQVFSGATDAALDDDDDTTALVPKKRRRKKKSEGGCFCCLRCLCKGCCAVLTCSCMVAADEQAEVAGAAHGPDDGTVGGILRGVARAFTHKYPSLFGRGNCADK